VARRRKEGHTDIPMIPEGKIMPLQLIAVAPEAMRIDFEVKIGCFI
jgi:hypothetical protein